LADFGRPCRIKDQSRVASHVLLRNGGSRESGGKDHFTRHRGRSGEPSNGQELEGARETVGGQSRMVVESQGLDHHPEKLLLVVIMIFQVSETSR